MEPSTDNQGAAAPQRSGLPPGSRLPHLLETIRYGMDPYAFLSSYQRRYGDPFGYSLLVSGYTVVTGDPEGMRAIFTADPDLFDAVAVDGLAPLIGDNAILVNGEPRHRAQRRLLGPPLNGDRMRAYGQLMQDVSRQAAERWVPGRPFSMLRAAQQLALDIMLQGFFGVTEPARMKTLGDAIFAWMTAYKHYLMLFKDLRRDFGGWGPWARFQRLARRLDDLVYAEIARRRAEQRYGEDILSLLLQARYEDGTTVGDQEIRDHLATLLNAGHETTAFVLTWAFYWLDRYPEARGRLQTELGALGADPDPEAVAGLPFLEAVCKETLRLHAPIPILGRLLKRPFTLKGYTLPAGTTIAPSPYLVHHREDLYPDPKCFKPERFLSRTYSSFEFLPFGGGTRRCPGSSFAIYAIKQALAMIVPRYVLGRTERRPVRPGMRGIIVGPTSDVEMVLQSLRSAA